jgi:hypothetical protein
LLYLPRSNAFLTGLPDLWRGAHLVELDRYRLHVSK